MLVYSRTDTPLKKLLASMDNIQPRSVIVVTPGRSRMLLIREAPVSWIAAVIVVLKFSGVTMKL